MSRSFTSGQNGSAGAGWGLDPTAAWSMCGWVYITADASGTNSDVFYSSGTSVIRIGYGYSGGPILVWVSGSTSFQASVSLNTWAHVGLTYDGAGTAKAYKDGSLVNTMSPSISSGAHTFIDIGCYDSTSTAEIAQVKVWAGYALTAAEMLAEKGYRAPVAGRGFVKGHWQLTSTTLLTDSSGNGYDLAGTSAAGTQTQPDQPTGVTLLNTRSSFIAGGNTAKPSAATLTTRTTALMGGVSDGMRNAASVWTTATTVVAGATVLKLAAMVLVSGTSFLMAGTHLIRAASTLTTGATLALLPASTVKNGAVVLTTTTHVQALGTIPILGASNLTTGSHLQLAAAKKLNAAAQLSTSTALSCVVNMTVGGAANLTSGSHLSFTSTLSLGVAQTWFSDEPNTPFTAHSSWKSESDGS